MDIGKSFTFPFEDPRWVTKILIGAGILLAGIVLSFLIVPAIVATALLVGYSYEITRRVIHGISPVLPEWENWGELIVNGLKVIVIGLVYALPAILVSICLGVPGSILQNESSSGAQSLGLLFSSVLACLNILWTIVLSLLLPAAIGKFADTGQLNSAFQFREVIDLVRNNFVTYLLVLVLSWVASLIGGLGILLCFIGVLATEPYSYMVTGHLYGQAYLEATRKAAAPVPTA